MQTNKKFKASVFSLLFSDPDLLRDTKKSARTGEGVKGTM